MIRRRRRRRSPGLPKWRKERAQRRRAWRLIPKLERKALSCAEIGQIAEAGAFALKALQLRTKYPPMHASVGISWTATS